ncbi:MAG: 3-phosphoshikimate 1-carboxyvinyltransferase [Bacteroidota bacterium]
MNYKVQATIYSGVIKIPSSKSDTQRALLAAALSNGISTLKNVGTSSDELAMLQAIQDLGAKIIDKIHDSILIQGFDSVSENCEINIGESGLASRLLIAVCSAFDNAIKILGKGSLLTRPMTFYDEILPKLNVQITSNNGCVPISVKGPIQASEIEIDGSLSSQFLSGLLMALPLANGKSLIHVKDLKSSPYIEMTLNTLSKFGIQIENKDFKNFIIQGSQSYKPTSYTIESDWSSASYWLVASALGQDIEIQGLSKDSLQADKAILKAFEKANCEISWENDLLKIGGKQRKAFEFDATDCPDLFPALASFAALTDGISKIKGVHRLKHKESDRAKSIQEEFQKLGVEVTFQDDFMLIKGKNAINGGNVFAHHDHRIAMCLAILGMFSKTRIEIENAESVSKSYPNFWKDLESLSF